MSAFPPAALSTAGEATLHSPEAMQYQLDSAAVLSGRNWSPGHVRPPVALGDRLDPVTKREWTGGPGGPGGAVSSAGAGAPRPLADTAVQLAGTSSTPRYSPQARVFPDQDPSQPSHASAARPLEAPARRRRDRSGSPTPPPKAAQQLTSEADVGTMDVERIRQQLKPGLGTVLQEAFNPRGRTSRRSTGAAVPAQHDSSGDLLANAAELLLRKKQQEAKEAEQSSTPPATDSLLYDVSVKLREHAAQVAEEGGPGALQDQAFEAEERKAAEDRLAAEKRKLEKEEEERIKEAIETEKRKEREQEERIRAAMEAEKRQQMEDEERRRRIEAEERREREEEEEERIRAAIEAEKRKEREREEEERMKAALEAERRKQREREEEERIKAALEADRKKEREREHQESAKAAIEAEKRKERREEEEDRFQASKDEKRIGEEDEERSERAQETHRKEREKDEEDRLRAMEVQLLLEPPSSLPQVLEELEARIQSALALGTRKEAALPSSPAVDLEDRGGAESGVAQEVCFDFRPAAPALPSAPAAAAASPREPQGRKARAVQNRSPSPGRASPAAAPPKVPILSAAEEMVASALGSPRSPLGPRFGLEQYEPYERFINHQLALLDEELRSIHAKEPYVQEQLQALEVQLRAVKLGWTPPEDLQRNSELRKAQEENERSEMRWRNFQATKIQCLVRKRQARKKVMAVRKKEEARVQQMSVAAMRQRMAEQDQKRVGVTTLRLQARWRGKVVRRWFLEQQEERKQLEERQRQQEEARAKQLSIEATRKMLQDRETQRLTFYAVKLQAWWRGRMTRQRYRAVQEERRRLQRQQRRLQEVSITSKRLQDVELQQRTRAAQKIQGAYRCRKAKKELRRLKMNKAKQEHDKWDALKLMFRRERESLEKLREDKARRTKEQLDKQVQRYRHRVQGPDAHGHRQGLDDRRLSDRRRSDRDRDRERDRRRSDAVESDTSSVMLAEAASMLLRTRHLEQPLRLRDAEGGDAATDSLLRDVAVRLQESAVVKMQAQFRGAISRRRVNDFKAKLVEQKEAALKERKLVEEERRAARRRDWDTKVSAMRRRLANLEERKQGDAAVTLQSNWRGHAERQRLKTSGELVEERRRRKLEEEAEKRRRDEDKIKKSAEAARRRKETEDEVQGRIRAAVEQTEMEVEERIKAAVEASEERIKAVVERKMPAAPYPMPMQPAVAPYPMPMQEGYMPPMPQMAPPMASAPGGGSTVNIRIGSGGVDYDGGAPQSRAPDPVLQERLQALEAQLKAIKDEEKEELRRAQEEEENEWRAQNYQATKIQSMFRGQHGRREASAERKKVEAAAQLRAQQNSVQAMRKLLEEREQRRLAHYAVKLQARWRGSRVRKKFLAEQEERKKVERQQKRQQEVEQISQRLIEVELAQRRRAAEMLQGAFRCRKARKELKRLKLLKDKEELAKMDEELKLKLQRDREELLRQMEAEKKRLRDMNRTIWFHIPFAEPTPEPPQGVQDRMVENQQRREESRKKRQQRLAEIQAVAERNARSGSPKSPRRRRGGGSPGRSIPPHQGRESPG